MFRQANAIGHFGKDGIITKFAVAKMFVEIMGGKTANLGTKRLRAFTSHNWRGRGSRRIQGQDNLGWFWGGEPEKGGVRGGVWRRNNPMDRPCVVVKGGTFECKPSNGGGIGKD
jgi:hypothetical protein